MFDTDPSHYFGGESGINVEKYTNGEDADSPTGPCHRRWGRHWTYVVHNTGNLAIRRSTGRRQRRRTGADRRRRRATRPHRNVDLRRRSPRRDGQYANTATVRARRVESASPTATRRTTSARPREFSWAPAPSPHRRRQPPGRVSPALDQAVPTAPCSRRTHGRSRCGFATRAASARVASALLTAPLRPPVRLGSRRHSSGRSVCFPIPTMRVGGAHVHRPHPADSRPARAGSATSPCAPRAERYGASANACASSRGEPVASAPPPAQRPHDLPGSASAASPSAPLPRIVRVDPLVMDEGQSTGDGSRWRPHGSNVQEDWPCGQ